MANAGFLKIFIIVTFIIFVMSYSFSCDNKIAIDRPAVKIGEIAPDFNLKDLHGKDVVLSSYRGKLILLEFWAAWCSPCRASAPDLVELQERYRDKGFVVLAVSMDTGNDKVSMLTEFAREFKINYPVLLDDNKTSKVYKVSSIPANYIIDWEGKVIDFSVGYDKDLEKKISGHIGNTI